MSSVPVWGWLNITCPYRCCCCLLVLPSIEAIPVTLVSSAVASTLWSTVTPRERSAATMPGDSGYLRRRSRDPSKEVATISQLGGSALARAREKEKFPSPRIRMRQCFSWERSVLFLSPLSWHCCSCSRSRPAARGTGGGGGYIVGGRVHVTHDGTAAVGAFG